ncbi:MAG TPA: Clp protease N-terminal domain-containing protein [Acidimicrobiales bacterium]|jgi:ATP-dependent Clp protease ATP-binding subunit ClpC
MPKVNVYLPEGLAAAVRDAQIPVSAVCQAALERAVRDVTAARSAEGELPNELPSSGLFGRFTPRARAAVTTLAQQAARDSSADHVGTEHILLGILDEGGNLAVKVLADLDVDAEDLRTELQASMDPKTGAAPEGHVPFTALSKRALELATKEALALLHNYIGCEHLLLGLLAAEEGLASKVLRRMGVELRTTRLAVTAALGAFLAQQGKPPAPTTPSPTTLDQILQRLDAIERRLPS